MFLWRRVAPQSPEEGLKPSATPGYVRNFRTLNRLISEGNSFSGYEHNPFFLNLGGEGFTNVAGLLGIDFDDDARAVATVDWDHDGDLDLWVTNRTSPRVRLLRNNHPHHGKSLLIRLIGNGTTTNKDAVGARISLSLEGQGGLQQIRTVRAGEGFLAQSSSWIHFGLGEIERAVSVQIAWPGGETESLHGLKAGKRYLINQSKGAQEIRVNSLSVDDFPVPEIDENWQEEGLWLVNRLPLPELSYIDKKGSVQSTKEFLGKPFIVKFWATGCDICLDELSELAKNQKGIQGLQATVLALNVDGLATVSQETSARDSASELARLGYKMSSGKARLENLGKIETLVEFITSRRRSLNIPSSFLVDEKGAVAAFYEGPLSWDQLSTDMDLLRAPTQARLTPRSGRWYEDPLDQDESSYLSDYATLFATNGFPDEAQILFDLIQPSGKSKSPQELYNQAKVATAQGEFEEAKKLYQAAIKVNPEYGQALTGLGALFLMEKRLDLAQPFFEKALAIDPNHATALINLAMIDRSRGNQARALERLNRVVELNPDYTAARLNLGSLYASMGEFPAAIVQLKKAMLLDPEQPAGRLTLAAVYADTKQWGKSKDLYLSVVESHPQIPPSFLGLGAIFEAEGRHRDAVKSYQRVIIMGGRSAQAYTGIARAFLALGEKKSAEKALKAALKINPNYPAALKLLQSK